MTKYVVEDIVVADDCRVLWMMSIAIVLIRLNVERLPSSSVVIDLSLVYRFFQIPRLSLRIPPPAGMYLCLELAF